MRGCGFGVGRGGERGGEGDKEVPPQLSLGEKRVVPGLAVC